MKTRFFLSAFALMAFAQAATAQIVTTGPFVGTQSEPFSQVPCPPCFHPCIPSRVFSNTGDLCTPGNSGAHTTGGWSFFCQIAPRSSPVLYGSAGGYTEITFDFPATSFGGYFGTNSNSPDGKAAFYDAANNFLGSFLVTAPANCTWTWNGWQVSSGAPIARVELYGSYPGGNSGFLMMDDLEVTYGAAPTVYCKAKVNSLGCTPSISGTGSPSASAPSGFSVDTAMVRNNKPGLYFYKVNGTQAALNFQCGTLCVGPQGIRRTPASSSGGSIPPANDCSGLYSLDFNCFTQNLCGGSPDPALQTVGSTVHAQVWGRDPGYAAPCNTTLSDALEWIQG